MPLTERGQWLARVSAIAAGASYADTAAIDAQSALYDLATRLGAVSVESALGLLGLWLQHHSRLRVSSPPLGLVGTTPNSNRWLAVRGAVPAAWAYINASSAAREVRGDRPRDLGLSVLTRLSRALKARDEIHFHLWGAFGTGSTDDVEFWFDTYLLMLCAAYDSLARATFLIYELGVDPRQRTWATLSDRQDDLNNELREALWGQGDAIRRLVFALRNSIHAEPLLAASGSDGQASTTILLDGPLADTIAGALDRATDDQQLGIDRHGAHIAVRPGPFLEHSIEQVLRHINRIMAATDLERLGVADYEGGPPDDDFFNPSATTSALALSGLGQFV